MTSYYSIPRFILPAAFLLLTVTHIFSQNEGFQFIQNKGQWEEPFLYKTQLANGEVFFRTTGISLGLYNLEQKNRIMEAAHDKKDIGGNGFIDAAGIVLDFVDPNPNVAVTGEDSYSFYHNYYKGNDPKRWASHVPVFRKVLYTNVYDGINMVYYTDSSHLKYDWIVAPGANPSKIKVDYKGAESIALYEGNLRIITAVNEWMEQKPYAYQLVNGVKTEVKCEFVLKDNRVSFKVGKYDHSKELIIDPTLIFASYSGSTRDNWGFTATYDFADNMYGGGIVFGTNAYPNTTGSYQLNFGGGAYDVLLCKFSSNGNNLLFYTYLGGASGDAPLSLVCNSANDIYVMGVTSSAAFPISSGAFQTTHRGGPSTNATGLNAIVPDFSHGSDLFITRLNSTGTTLIASTFVGGTGNDGLNIANAGLNHNYADQFRGEIVLDNTGNVYIGSCTKSSDFPVSSPFQPANNGNQDAVVCKFNANLTNMLYGSYLGGTGDDAAYSLQLNTSNEVYITGGTTSTNFPVTPGVIDQTYNGNIDGFLSRISASGAVLMNSTYLGTAGYDQSYNVQLDDAQNPYVFGQSTGGYPVTGGVYSNPNSGQFIHKLNPSLTTTGFSTVVGRGIPGMIDIVPTAFLVDVCDYIYLAGWGGQVNATHGGGGTGGLPITGNAHQSTTDGSDFYLMVLDNNASGLQYATYFGGGVSDEHVDGGTSRFDKNGIVYEAVCAGCGSNDDFPTTPGAWSNTNNSPNCNLGVFKFDISQFSAIIDPLSTTTICANGVVTLQNGSTGGFSITWDFGDGTQSTDQVVNHQYSTPGTYMVYLTVNAPSACLIAQQDSLLITVEAPPVANITNVPPICKGATVQLQASGGTTYTWDASSSLSSTSVANPFAFPSSTTNYTVHVSNNCGSDDASVTVTVIVVDAQAGPDVRICNGQSTQLDGGGGASYSWTNGSSLNDPNAEDPVATPGSTTTYAVTVTDNNGCSATDTVVVTVETFPVAQVDADQTLCIGSSYQFNASGGTTYSWNPANYLDDPTSSSPVSTPSSSITYVVGASNSCGTDFDTVNLRVIIINAQTVPDVIICPGDSTLLTATGGTDYTWTPTQGLNPSAGPAVMASPDIPTTYIVQVNDTNGCSDFDTVFVDLYPSTDINLGANILIPFGGEAQLNAQGNGMFFWTPDSFLTCANCPNPIASPFSSTQYVVELTDANGCKFYDSLMVYVEGSLYVPNTFTPNMDGFNNIFFAYGVEIKNFEMRIFNRWGQEIFETFSLTYGWDGTYANRPCPIGVYVWKIEYTELSGKSHSLMGHVNLLR